MELRGRDKDIGISSTRDFNQESSSKLSSAPLISPGAGGEKRINETLDHHHHHQFGRSDRVDPNPDLDPAQLACGAIAGTSNSTPPPPPLPTTTNSAISIGYRECLKNHAASIGGHVVDGCGEFMPSGEEGTLEALKCAACECHRNFHRKEVQGQPRSVANCYYYPNPNSRGRNTHTNTNTNTLHPTQPPPSLPTLPPQHHKYAHGLTTSPLPGPMPPMMMAFGGSGGAPAESSNEDLNMFQSNAVAQPMGQPSFSVSKKRFRTKFSREQKDKMQEFAEKLGWKMQKQDEEEVQHFLNEVGVKRQVFKVWMHNNKQAMKKKQM